MLGFDRKIRKRAKRFQVPDSYYRKVDGTLDKIKEDHVAAPRRQPFVKAALYLMVLCLMISGFILLSDMKSAEAGFWRFSNRPSWISSEWMRRNRKKPG